ncbi:hypothetical protein QZH41_015264 [Actinostola sp. cb2023]|nr:hypothetical protein QZH41_015264 [Actinostola sp. cb2023]
MEMREYKVSGYTRVVRRRAFTKWINIHLNERFLAISDLVDLADCFITIQLLEIITKRNFTIKYCGQQPIRIKRIDGWTNVALFLKTEDFPSDISEEDIERLSRGSVDALLAFVWFLIELFLINPCKNVAMLGKTPSSARNFLLSWLKQKLPHRSINNFDGDWKDGTAICELVNSLQPGAIPEKDYSDKENGESNAKLGIQVAHDKFGIPQIVSAFDIASAHIDELSILTYIALFCKYESLIQDDGRNNNKITLRDNEQMTACKAYGSGLKSGELGKIAEFIVELNGAKASDITIAIECKPATGGVYDKKPELSVKAVGKSTYAVKYLPTKQGEYIISVLYCGAHILRSPFHLTVTGHTKVNGVRIPEVYTSNDKSAENIVDIKETLQETPLPTYKAMEQANTAEANPGLTESIDKTKEKMAILVTQVRDIPLGIPMNAAEGPGLVAGEVGRVGKFTVITDNTTKGPLSVCISCPAVSIPVPYVKSEKEKTYTEHRVLYIPTEPGTYEIFIKWGEKGIRGSPFKVFINDVNQDDVSLSSATSVVDLGGKDKIRVYYAATSMRTKVRKDKQMMEIFLKEKGILSRSDFDSWIALDVGMTKAQRETVFKKAGHRSTPVLFVDDRCIGTYEDILIMDREGIFDSYLE